MPRLSDKNIIFTSISSRRPPWVSSALSLLCPGLGQLHNCEGAKGLVLTMSFLLAMLLVPLYCVVYGDSVSIKIILLMIFSSICFWAYGIIDAGIIAQKKQVAALKRYVSGPVYAVYASVSLAALAGTLFALTACLDLMRIGVDSMTPALLGGEWVLLNRYQGKGVRASDVMVYNSRKGYQIGRVIAVPGETVLKAGASFIINNQALTLGVFSPADIDRYGLTNSEDLYFEERDGSRYPIRASSSAVARRTRGMAWKRLKEDQILLAVDDRTGDEEGVVVTRSDIIGRVEGIVFSPRLRRVFQKPRFPAVE